MFESGAIMIHPAEKDPNGTFLPKDTRKKAEVVSWLMFQMVLIPKEQFGVLYLGTFRDTKSKLLIV